MQCMCRTKEPILLHLMSTGCLQYCLFVQKNSLNVQLQGEGRKKGFLQQADGSSQVQAIFLHC